MTDPTITLLDRLKKAALVVDTLGKGITNLEVRMETLDLSRAIVEAVNILAVGTALKPTDIPLLDMYARKLEPGEPYFILMGRDALAAKLVRLWATNADDHELADDDKIKSARVIADAMEVWHRQKNPPPEAE